MLIRCKIQNMGVQEWRKGYVFRRGDFWWELKMKIERDSIAGNGWLCHCRTLQNAGANKVVISLNETAVHGKRIILRLITHSLCRNCKILVAREQHYSIFHAEAEWRATMICSAVKEKKMALNMLCFLCYQYIFKMRCIVLNKWHNTMCFFQSVLKVWLSISLARESTEIQTLVFPFA